MSTKLDQNFVESILAKDPLEKEDMLTLVREIERLESLEKKVSDPGVNPELAKSYKTFESRGFASPEHGILVESLKVDASALLATINAISIPPDNAQEVGRLVSLAKTELEASVMWAVKAISRFNK